MTTLQAIVIRGLAQNGLRRFKAAKKLNYSRSAIDYHVSKIREQTGKDPLDFYDMCELIEIANEILECK